MLATFALVVGLFALLATPLDITFAIQQRAVFSGRVTLRWLFGLLRIRLPPSGPKKGPRPRKSRRGKRWASTSHLAHRSLAILKSEALRRRILRFGLSVLRSFRRHDLDLRVRLGLDDPADTGILGGLARPAIALLRARPSAKVDLELNFLEPCFEADARGTVRVIPLQVAYVILTFVLSPTVLWAASSLLLGSRRGESRENSVAGHRSRMANEPPTP